MMAHYRVTWGIDIFDAETPRAAAAQALTYVREGSLSQVFEVESWDGTLTIIDLSPGAGTEDVDMSTDREHVPQTSEEARVCIHGNTVWFGHECGLCDDAGRYVWQEEE